LEESGARGALLANAIFHRTREVVVSGPDPYAALREDAGLRAILESSIYSKNVTYAAIVDAAGVTVASSDRSREGRPAAAARPLDALMARSALAQIRAIYARDGQTLEVNQPLLLGGQRFGSIRVGVSTLLIRRDLDGALRPALATALIALAVATIVAMFLSGLILRPIHVIRSGLSRLGRGEFGVTLDLPQRDEFGELGTFFNALSAQLSADRSQLAGQKVKLESVVEHLEDAVAIVNPDGELLFANPAMKATLPADPQGRAIDDLLPPDHPYRTLIEETRASGQSRGPIAATIAPPAPAGNPPGEVEGGERLLITHAIRDLDQRLVGVMLVGRNLHYLSRVQSTVNYSRKLVALGRLSAGVAHEVKNPLNAMTIHLELLKQKLLASAGPAHGPEAVPGTAGGPDGAPALRVPGALEHVKIIAGEIRRLDEVVQGFLKFTRPEELKLQPIKVSLLIEGVLRVVEPEARKAGIDVRVEGVETAPGINGDPAMLRQALLNLALNGCQAMPNGGTLRIAAGPASGRRVALTIEDTGTGIRPEHLGKIFDLYFTTKPQGTGIGLSMVYRTIQLHDGEVEVESVEGRGTTFRLLLPQVESAHVQVTPPAGASLA
ncbi:MAG: HAMP domain-containing protein, partial [Acidobacteria bacterium]|nr:HAMP domain-containing protein [Acidobacteriota bacterium]